MVTNDASAPIPVPSLAGILELARTQRLSFTDLFQFAESRSAVGQRLEAADVYKVWIAFNETHPFLHLVYFNYSVTLRQLGDVAGSIHALRACLKLNPRFGPAHINLGRALEDSGVATQAILQWQSFVEMTAESTADGLLHRLLALQHIGRVMGRLRQFFRLSALRDELETRLLAREYRSLLLDDHFEDGTDRELQSTYAELTIEISSRQYRHRH